MNMNADENPITPDLGPDSKNSGFDQRHQTVHGGQRNVVGDYHEPHHYSLGV